MNASEYKEYVKKADEGTLKDDLNPIFIFSLTSNELLVKSLKGEFDLKALIEIELKNRGLNSNGEFIGFKKR